MSRPGLTVLMTAYNAMPYIRETVACIFEQTHRDFTFLIINNGSKDGTGAFLSELQEKEADTPAPALRVVHLEANIGRTPALNKGLGLVDTEFTAIMDADDIALPDRLARQLDYLQHHPNIDLVGSDVTYIDATGNITGKDSLPASHEELRDNLPLHNQFAHSACMFRTDKARAVGGYSAEFPYAQDLALWIDMLKAGSRAGSIPEPLARIRVHPGQATRNLSLLMVRTEDNHKLAEAMLDIPGLSPASRQAARLRSAGALFKLGRWQRALSRVWLGIKEAPLLLPVNPLLWRRLALEWKRRRGKSNVA